MPNALAHAIREVSWEFSYFWEHDLKDFVVQVWHSAIVPVLVVMIILLTVLQSIVWFRQQPFYRRRIARHNPTKAARQCHIQALSTAFPKIFYYKTQRKQQAAFHETVQLLQQAIAFDPHYEPPYLSWAALYLYTPDYRDAAMAQHILQQLQQIHIQQQATMMMDDGSGKSIMTSTSSSSSPQPKSDDDAPSSNHSNSIHALELDATALLAGQPEHMLQDVLRRDEFLSPAFAAAAAAALSSSLSSAMSSKNDNKNNKKLQ